MQTMLTCTRHPRSRRGITLIEVLIAIGIFAIGLTSVAALLPAGGSQARKAMISDRSANLAENALADAVTIGLTRPASHTAAITTMTRVVIDPAGALELSGVLEDSGLRTTGVLGSGNAASSAVGSLFGRGRDDIVYGQPATEDGLPTNALVNGARGFDGRTSCLWAIESCDGVSLAAGRMARLSAVIFHDRDLALRTLNATLSATGEISLTPPAGRTIREILKAGTVIVVPPANFSSPSEAAKQSVFFGLRSASPTASETSVFGVFDRQPPAGACTILIDSVGIAQAIVALEGSGPFSSAAPREVVP